ncbi:RsmB/NOP family class I SAM-dependent RNA methyltransferase [Rhabdaerophilum calidifontis]|uniref:RsmB/NOP family class I SAM-dependent RNA methyltransferase n=1 Tax=Rhabdaerophilum calidifontis TaxID=2604328 RepID=UPI003CCC531E
MIVANPRSGSPRRRRPAGMAVPGLAPRRVAAEAIRRVLRERRSLDEALQFAGAAAIEPPDAALARAIATVAFRRMGTIRAALAERLRDGSPPDIELLDGALLIGAAQILFMEVPDHAAVHLSVELVKSDARAMHYAPLVNAVLRRIAGETGEILAASDTLTTDMPGWLRARWGAAYGEATVRAIADAHRLPPHIDLTPTGPAAALAAATGGEVLPTGSVRLRREGRIADLPGYAEGAFLVQDAASALPARLVGAQPGQRIADLCAAPGGKTAQLALTGAQVVAVERSAMRATRIRENLARLRLEAELVIADAGTFTGGPFDAVLLDAPCSATGTIRRHPEIAWSKRLEDILTLAGAQARLLAHAATLVRAGGRLVYATCSLEPEEGERQIARFLEERPDFMIEPVRPGELGIEPAAVTTGGLLRVLPSHGASYGGMDGFFAARLRRRE